MACQKAFLNLRCCIVTVVFLLQLYMLFFLGSSLRQREKHLFQRSPPQPAGLTRLQMIELVLLNLTLLNSPIPSEMPWPAALERAHQQMLAVETLITHEGFDRKHLLSEVAISRLVSALQIDDAAKYLQHQVDVLDRLPNGTATHVVEWAAAALRVCNRSLRTMQSASEPARHLIITIPTMMRGHVGYEYLDRTLEALYDEIGENHHLVQIVVVSNDREGQFAFQNASRFLRAKYAGLFIAENETPIPPLLENDVSVQRQALNLAFMLSRQFSRSKYLLIMEDDFVLCTGALRLILCIIRAASRVNHDWKAMRISYGMNGVLLQNKDVPSLVTYLIMNMFIKPSDHNIVEWFLGETADGVPTGTNNLTQRPYFVYRYNLMSHIGYKSTFSTAFRFTPICHDTMDGRMGLRSKEAFEPVGDCLRSELWPCWGKEVESNSSFRISEQCRSHHAFGPDVALRSSFLPS